VSYVHCSITLSLQETGIPKAAPFIELLYPEEAKDAINAIVGHLDPEEVQWRQWVQEQGLNPDMPRQHVLLLLEALRTSTPSPNKQERKSEVKQQRAKI